MNDGAQKTAAVKLEVAERELERAIAEVRRSEDAVSYARANAEKARAAFDAAYKEVAERYQKVATDATQRGFPSPSCLAVPK